MKKRICCLCSSINSIESMKKYWCFDDDISSHFIWDENDPEIVFVTTDIYVSKDCFNKLRRLYKNPRRVYVMHGDEMMEPDLTLFDYSVGWRHPNDYDGRCYRMPISIKFPWGRNDFNRLSYFNSVDRLKAKRLLQEKTGFCNFIYSNRFSIPIREKLFKRISEYKRVDSLGAVFHNTDMPVSRSAINWFDISVDNKRGYKFSITVENGIYSGYTTEKILSSFYAGSIPIYFGDPDIGCEFNLNAMIDVQQFNSLDEVVEEIRRIDEDDDAWIQMVCEPWYTDENIDMINREIERYHLLLNRLINDEIETLIRRPIGTFNKSYCNCFFEKKFFSKHIDRIKSCVERIWSENIKKDAWRSWPDRELWKNDKW